MPVNVSGGFPSVGWILLSVGRLRDPLNTMGSVSCRRLTNTVSSPHAEMVLPPGEDFKCVKVLIQSVDTGKVIAEVTASA